MTDNFAATRYEIDILSNRSNRLKLADTHISSVFEQIHADLLRDDFKRFHARLNKALSPQDKYLTDTEQQLYGRGKKLRPMMLMLSAHMMLDGAELPDKVIMAAVSLEMLHVASLIHDDIIDGALMRRGLESVNVTRGVNTAILVGDLQFLQAIRNFIDAVDTDSEMNLVKMVLDTSLEIVYGELDELSTDQNWDTRKLKAHYYEVIERKTAVLFGLSCESGVALTGARTSDSRRIGHYGRKVGLAFQIMDDLFDNLASTKNRGKMQGTDLAQKCLSLPIIYAMEELGDYSLVSRIIRGEIEPDEAQLAEGVEMIKLSNGFGQAYADARHQALSALEYLKYFPDNRYRQALEHIALAIVDRNY